MTRFMFPYIGFMSLVALSAGILNTWKRFAVPAATPVLLNLAMIAAVWLAGAAASPRSGIEPIYALAAGVMLGGVLQLAVQMPALARLGLLPRIGAAPRRDRARPGATPACAASCAQMAPALLGVSVAQLSLLINTQIASHQGVGAVSWLDLRRPADGVPDRAARRRARRGADAAAVGGAGARATPPATRACSTGACAWRCCSRCRARWRCWCSRSRWSRRCSTTARSTRRRRAQDGAGAARLRRRPDRPDRRQDPGAGLLRAPGHAHAGDDRGHRAGADPG